MNNWWEELQAEYDALLLKQPRTDQDWRRINEIEAALFGQFGPDWIEQL